MSFLLRTATRTLASTASRPSTRLLSTSPITRKSAAETAKEKLDAANKKVGEAGVAGIEKGRT